MTTANNSAMRKAVIVFLFLLPLILLKCKNSPATQAFYLNGGFIGIREGRTIKFYETKDQKNWTYISHKEFTGTDDIDDAFYFNGDFIGIRQGRTIKFYKTNKKG